MSSPHTSIIYQTESGERPFVDWIEGLKSVETRQIINTRVGRVRLGNFGKCESVGSGVQELKIYHGPGYRVYFAKIGGRVVLLLCGGDKSSQKSDIKKAKEFLADFKRRSHGEKKPTKK